MPATIREVQLPVELSAAQAECYRTTLARYYETLADPKPARCAVTCCSVCNTVNTLLECLMCCLVHLGTGRMLQFAQNCA